MKAKICDRCGAVYSDDMERTLHFENKEFEDDVDICNECFNELYGFFTVKTQEVEEENLLEELVQEEEAGWFEYEKE